MTIRRVLIYAPIFVMLFLLQSYFWVPTYEEQSRGNPERLNEYITASIGDAQILNPILSSDSASSQIESMVFEGLLDRDENLNFRGRLAQSWEIFEEAFFYVNDSSIIPGLGILDADQIVKLLKKQEQGKLKKDSPLIASLNNIKDICVIPSDKFVVTKSEVSSAKEQKYKEIELHVSAPARIKLSLNQVDQNLFQNLKKILGEQYFSSFQAGKYTRASQPLEEEKFSKYAEEILPPTEQNPILIFHLRPEVKFHDGHVFDAYDVKFTYDAIMNPKNLSPRVSDYEPIKAIKVIDPMTIRIGYKRLYSPAIGTWGIGILPEHLLNKKTLRQEAINAGRSPDNFSMRESSFNRHPVGCGPYEFQEWKPDQYISLDCFDDYWEGSPNYKEYIYRIIPDLLTQEMEFYAGTVDSYGVQPHQVKRLKNDPAYQSFSGLSFGYTYIGYNMRRAPFNDARVRKALGMAIDVEKIIKYVLYGEGERITGPFVKQTDYYNHGIKPIPYDPDGALMLLKEAGWKRNKEGWLEKEGKRLQFTLITNSGNDLRKSILAITQESWKQIGIDVRTDLLEWAVFIQERVDKADFDALILGWSMGIEPDLYQIWHSSQDNPYQLNFVGYNSPMADELIVKIRKEYDHSKQVEYCHRLHEIIAKDQPYTFLYVPKWTAVLDKKIVIKETDPRGNVVYKKIKPTKTGSYTFHFNKWVKLPEAPDFYSDG